MSIWSWKSLALAIVLALFVYVLAALALGGTPPKNIVWTVMWLYLTIEAWKNWKWKALLPYPMFIGATVVLGVAMGSDNVENQASTDLLVYGVLKVTLNIGGLIAFYTALSRARRLAASQNPVGATGNQERMPMARATISSDSGLRASTAQYSDGVAASLGRPSESVHVRTEIPARSVGGAPSPQDIGGSQGAASLSDGAEDQMYDRIAQELESGTPERAVWTRAFAEANGDDRHAKALYIKLRFAKLFAEEKERLAGVARAAEEECIQRAREEREDIRRKSLAVAAQLGSTMVAARFRLAVRTGDLSAVRQELSRDRLLVNATDSEGCTPLMLAAEEGRADVVGLLLDSGAATDCTNRYGQTARSIADKKGHVVLLCY